MTNSLENCTQNVLENHNDTCTAENTIESHKKYSSLNEKLSLDFPKSPHKDRKFYYLLQVKGDPNFKLSASSARISGGKAEFLPEGWVFQNETDAEEVAKRWTEGKRTLIVVRWKDPHLDAIWNGSKQEAIIARKSIRNELEKSRLNTKKGKIELQCDHEGLHYSWLHKTASELPEDMSEKEKKTHAYFKPIWEKTFEEQEEIDLRGADIAREKEDLDIENIEKKKRKEVSKLPKNGLPIVKIIPGQLHHTTDSAIQILNSNQLGVFQRGGQLVRIITEVSKPKKNKLIDKDGSEIIKRSADALLIAAVDPVYLTELLGKHANWAKFDERKSDWILKDCPERVAMTLIARREWNVPVLTGIIQAPTLRPDGSILDKPGYDEITGLFFNAGSTSFQALPSHPIKEEAIEALIMLLELLKGFPFENDESKSVAISAILTGLIRKSIRTAPLHGFTAPKMGTGKSLLADVVALIATGKGNSVIPQAENEAEEKKRLLSVLAEGDSFICYDNIEHPFGSPALCSVLTQEEFKDRLLGLNRSLSVLTNATFLATGNNLTFVGDTSTRVILCRLDPQIERPEERNFDTDLKQYIPQHRGELVKAALTILRAYHIAGRPKQNIAQFGRFEDWSDWIRSSLVWLGMKDPCTSRKEIENADPIRQSLGNLLVAWYDAFGDLSIRSKDIIKKAGDPGNEALLDSLLELAQKDTKICPVKLGKKLHSFEKRIENGFRIQKTGKHQNADLWRVTKI